MPPPALGCLELTTFLPTFGSSFLGDEGHAHLSCCPGVGVLGEHSALRPDSQNADTRGEPLPSQMIRYPLPEGKSFLFTSGRGECNRVYYPRERKAFFRPWPSPQRTPRSKAGGQHFSTFCPLALVKLNPTGPR